MEAKIIVHAQMPLKLVKEARLLATKKDLSMSHILRMALTKFLRTEKGRK